ncbi:hypothetical protein AB0N05_37725 [Nocardia sp. NPDC051030]|uniref:hypothetical protein n=1 Tax=Nocardia sp. NPDC051030 TaxID=3155162 RepID=UPI00341D40B0
MESTATQRVTAAIGLAATVVFLTAYTAPEKVAKWARTTRGRGEIVSQVILIAGLAVLAVAAGGFIAGKVWEHLNRIQ